MGVLPALRCLVADMRASDAARALCRSVQSEAREGKTNLSEVPLHQCICPPCFTESMKDGKLECTPKCDLSQCDEPTGVCRGAAGSSGALAQIRVEILG